MNLKKTQLVLLPILFVTALSCLDEIDLRDNKESLPNNAMCPKATELQGSQERFLFDVREPGFCESIVPRSQLLDGSYECSYSLCKKEVTRIYTPNLVTPTEIQLIKDLQKSSVFHYAMSCVLMKGSKSPELTLSTSDGYFRFDGELRYIEDINAKNILLKYTKGMGFGSVTNIIKGLETDDYFLTATLHNGQEINAYSSCNFSISYFFEYYSADDLKNVKNAIIDNEKKLSDFNFFINSEITRITQIHNEYQNEHSSFAGIDPHFKFKIEALKDLLLD